MNPILLALITEAAGESLYTVMDYVKVIGGIALAGLTIYKIGDLKMILYVLSIGVAVVLGVMFIPQLEGTQIQAIVLDLVEGIPEMITDLLGGST